MTELDHTRLNTASFDLINNIQHNPWDPSESDTNYVDSYERRGPRHALHRRQTVQRRGQQCHQRPADRESCQNRCVQRWASTDAVVAAPLHATDAALFPPVRMAFCHGAKPRKSDCSREKACYACSHIDVMNNVYHLIKIISTKSKPCTKRCQAG